jgi:hypothetical protein
MPHRGGQDHDDVALSWLSSRSAARLVMPVGLAVSVGLAVPVRAAVREQSASPFG